MPDGKDPEVEYDGVVNDRDTPEMEGEVHERDINELMKAMYSAYHFQGGFSPPNPLEPRVVHLSSLAFFTRKINAATCLRTCVIN